MTHSYVLDENETAAPDVMPADDAARIAEATKTLRVMAAIQRDIAFHEDALAAEIAALTEMAQRKTAPLYERLRDRERWVCALAELIEWPKRIRSHDTPFGSFGVRASAATLKVVDEGALTQWVETNRPKYIKASPKLMWGELKKTLDPSEETLPPGVERVPETVTAFAKVAQ